MFTHQVKSSLPVVAELCNVTHRYRLGQAQVTALQNINLEIHRGQFLALAGPSGSGKSSLLNLLAGIDTLQHGQLRLLGQTLEQLNDNERADFRAQHIGIVFQSFNLLPVLNTLENVEYALALQNRTSSEIRERALWALNAVGLGDRLDHRPSQLSGGQRQRVAIARALAGEPALVMADEPTANLDSKTGHEILDLMLNLQRTLRTTFIIASHDSAVHGRADHTYHLVDGQLQSGERAA